MKDLKIGTLGQAVTYVSSAGFQKVAIVIGTQDSVVPGGSIPAPDEHERHLLVISVTGKQYTRYNVPFGPFETPGGDTVSTGVWFA